MLACLVLVGCRPAAVADAHDDATIAMPGPARAARAPERVDANAGCVRCHPRQAAEWSASQHRTAYTDPEFQRALVRERPVFCRGCHAPEADPSRPPDVARGSLGVGCVSCHVPDGTTAVLAAPGEHAPAPHAVVRSAAFGEVEACASCHEFAFPRTPEVPMQSTVTEHRHSRFADRSCGACHMPWVGDGAARHRDHGFAASRDPAMLRAALEISTTREPPGRVRVRVGPGAVGHAVPTGDLFRRLWIEVEAGDDGELYDARALSRHVLDDRLVGDDRPGAPALAHRGGVSEIELDLGDAAIDRTITWRIYHQRVELPLDGDDALVFGETLVAEGQLSPTQPP